ncbi:ABC transporter permease [Paenibacillus athensensis]|uniref:ABC transporter permease n=1 Tax=Paenibacillus athensensis TaxID=1967502 RepID=A0A4Y8PVT6_9BACL|nr:ABC transporter permease [Paenibacillus athensensis]MCD1258002.1 ABC transporter permease [Paenibacillus athensensis]
MFNLIRNENMKVYRRPRTWLLIGILIFVVLFSSFMEWYYDQKDAATEGSWQQEISEQKADFVKMLAEPKLNPENRKHFEERIKVIDYQLEHNIHPEDATMWDGTNNSAELIILITLLTVIIAGDSLAGEFAGGTIKLLLIRPASRLQILLSKYMSMILFGLLLVVILFVVSTLFNGLLYRFADFNLPLVQLTENGQIVEKNMFANLWQTYLLNGVSTIMFVTLAFMISTAFRSSALAIGFSIFVLFAGTLLMQLLQPYAWSKYLLFSSIDLSQYLNGRPYQEGMTLTFSIAVLSVYFLLFNLISWLVFTKRDVAV